MSDLEQQIKQLRVKQEKARQIKARAEIQRESARTSAEKIITKLKNEFGVNSLEEAQNLQNSMEKELLDIVEEITLKLAEFD